MLYILKIGINCFPSLLQVVQESNIGPSYSVVSLRLFDRPGKGREGGGGGGGGGGEGVGGKRERRR